MKRGLTFAAVLGAVLGFSSAGGQASAVVSYECGGGDLSILVTFDPMQPDQVIVRYGGSDMMISQFKAEGKKLVHVLPSTISGSGMAFAAGQLDVHMKGKTAIFTEGGQTSTCKQVAQQAGQPQKPQTHADGAVGGKDITVNWQGRSYGGKLRNGPGINFKQVGSLAEGAYVTLLVNTGILFNGYTWFEVSYGNGKKAYQWGGILCSNGKRITGIYKQCQ